jgi:predicted 3-demethylubiquinone-9 3-methyltransferase (glyoxalase superfamily)
MPITPFLMFAGAAEEAMTFYVSLFPNSRIHGVSRYGAGQTGKEGTLQQARFEIDGQSLMCIDSPAEHAFTFTPAMSLYVTLADTDALDAAFHALAHRGQVYMRLDAYPFSPRFGWVQDRFGVSWQLGLG